MLLALASATCSLFASSGAGAQDVRIPFTKTSLPNGMVVVFAEDHAVPQVDVSTVYAVGSRMERPGRTGFSHLFEHLMFMGTRRAPTGAFDAWMEQAGGRNNASTREDSTEFYDLAPPTALPLLLWLEADRMRDLGRDIDAQKLALQRDVVLNERRQSIENRPYGVEELVLPTLLWPEGHPYHHPVIGSPDDLRAATVADVKHFFDTWYDPSNATLVVAGDFDAGRARDLVDRWLATIPSRGKPAEIPRPEPWTATSLAGIVRRTVADDVELAKVTLAWQSPRHLAPGDAELDLLASVLSTGKASRLYESLVYDQKIAQSVEAAQESRSLASQLVVTALVRPGVDPAKVERALLDQVARLTAQPVTAEELQRAQAAYETAFVERLESVAGRASLLGDYQVETGDPGYVQRDLDRYRKATVTDLLQTARRVLLPDRFVSLTIVPRKGGKR
ncbi:MAG: M16 family metallopeptidase [Polyangiaceae bacterium]